MNKRKITLLVFYTLSLAAALWYPVNKIIKFECPAVVPVEVKFKAFVYDPYDPMRGRYVRLQVKPDRVVTSDRVTRFRYGDIGYAVIAKDKQGYAKILRLEKSRSGIKKGEIAVKIRKIWYSSAWRKNPAYYNFNWPFDRYYLNELKAPELEAELQSRKTPFALKVRIWPDGDCAVSGLLKR